VIASAPFDEPATRKPVDIDQVYEKMGVPAKNKPSVEETKDIVKIQKPASVLCKNEVEDDWNQVVVRKEPKIKESLTDDMYSKAPKRQT
jgi:hypothetical protein